MRVIYRKAEIGRDWKSTFNVDEAWIEVIGFGDAGRRTILHFTRSNGRTGALSEPYYVEGEAEAEQ